MVSSLKKKPKKQQQQKQKWQKRISLEPCTGTILSKTHNIYIQLYRRSGGQRMTEQHNSNRRIATSNETTQPMTTSPKSNRKLLKNIVITSKMSCPITELKS